MMAALTQQAGVHWLPVPGNASNGIVEEAQFW